MKKILNVGAVGLVVVGLLVIQSTTTRSAVGVTGEPLVSSVPVDQFATLVDRGDYTVIDIRTPAEIATGKVTSDALELDYYAPDFKQQLADLDPEGAYAVYCRSGNRTSHTVAMMQELGFTNVVDLTGGKQAWEQSGRTLVPGTDCGTVAC